MPDEKKVIHVNQVGENWEVESDGGTLGQAESQPEAIELATELANEGRADQVQVHTSDGQIDKTIAVPPKDNSKEGC
jgi:hypothetical protein